MEKRDNVFIISEAEQVHCINAAAISYNNSKCVEIISNLTKLILKFKTMHYYLPF